MRVESGIICLSSVHADKSEDDVERESQLLECRLTLTEERNTVLVPSAGSGIPGAPVERCGSCPLLLNSEHALVCLLNLFGPMELIGSGPGEANYFFLVLVGANFSVPSTDGENLFCYKETYKEHEGNSETSPASLDNNLCLLSGL